MRERREREHGMKHILHGLLMGYRTRYPLCRVIGHPCHQLDTVTGLDPAQAAAEGVRCFILDFDGVLASHGETEVPPEVFAWLTDLTANHPEIQAFILSNKPTAERARYFQSHFPAVTFIKAKRKKPYTDGIDEVLQRAGVAPQQAIMFDDRLLTGVLAGLLARTRVKYIARPYSNYAKRPGKEAFFTLLRVAERLILKLIAFMPKYRQH